MLDYLDSTQKKILCIIGIILMIIAGIFFYNFYNRKNTSEIENLDQEILVTNNFTEGDSNEENGKEFVVIHITGGVKTPGVVKLEEGSRIEDAIEKAGGLTEDADISNVNLAYILDDGIKIRIPTKSETENEKPEELNENIISEENGADIIRTNENTSSKKNININKASTNELETLPGIGPSLASKIVQYRQENGKFLKTEDIKNVNGLGESKYESIKDLISVK